MLPRTKAIATASVRLGTNQDEIFAFLVEPKNTQLWNEAVKYVSHRPAGPIRPGSVVLCSVHFLGVTTQATYRYISIDSPDRCCGEGSSRYVTYRDRFELATPSIAGWTDVSWWVEIEYPSAFPLPASWVSDTITRELNAKLQALKEIFE